MVNVDGFFSTIKAALGIPAGTSWRKGYGLPANSNGGATDTDLRDNPYAEAICDITADDVCRGETPVSYNYELPDGEEELPKEHLAVLDSFKDELNSVVRWISKDLQMMGVSVYDVTLDKEANELHLLPNLKELKFYLTKDKRIVAYDMSEVKKEKQNLEDVIIFINYEKSSLLEVPENSKDLTDDIKFEITPTPMQFKNTKSTLDALNMIENALKRYRAQLSRIVRYATVDIGLSNGDTQKDVVEAIAAAINADSMNLSSTTNEEFNDNIPVIPTRNGKGEPKLTIDKPEGDIKEVVDLKYFLDKLCLITRFPATYMDFSQALGGTAASMILGDLRYAKLCASIRTLIEKTINEFISRTKSLENYNVVYSLIQLPTSEDDDVLQAMSNYVELTSKVDEFVMSDNDEEEPIDVKIHRLKMIQGLFNASVKSPVLQDWFNDYIDYLEDLKTKRQEDEVTEQGEGSAGDFEGGGDFGGGEDFGGGGLSDLGEPDFTGEDIGRETDLGGGGAPEIEMVEPQTE